MPYLLTIKDLNQRLGKREVLKHVNLVLNQGELLGLVGKSGSGKTTLLRCIMGFYEHQRGQMLLNGEDVSSNPIKLKRIVGFTTQENSFYAQLTVEENLRYFGNLYKLGRKQLDKRIDTVLHLVSLSETRRMLGRSLSGGMKRRLDFAISLLHDPEILILDEPDTGLDPQLRT
ncbi:MAG: ABC transporter ATP-binding protein [Nitrosarchaeum sp.]|nr:ABC transporter ATP-binding protein [Nitrosarchaeum sp.]